MPRRWASISVPARSACSISLVGPSRSVRNCGETLSGSPPTRECRSSLSAPTRPSARRRESKRSWPSAEIILDGSTFFQPWSPVRRIGPGMTKQHIARSSSRPPASACTTISTSSMNSSACATCAFRPGHRSACRSTSMVTPGSHANYSKPGSRSRWPTTPSSLSPIPNVGSNWSIN